MNWEQNLGDGWKFQNALRFSKNNILYNTPSTITTISATDYVSYYLLTGLEGLGVGNYSYKNVNTGEEVMNVSSAIGSNGLPVYTVNNNNLPGQDLLENGLFAIIFGSYQNKVNEIVDQFTLQKTTDNMTYTIGGYYGYSDVDRYSGIDGIALGTIQNRPEQLSLTFTGATLGGTAGEHMVTNADGIGQANGDNGTSLNFKATQKQMVLFFGHTWNIDDEFTFDWGFRYENVGVSEQNERAYMKTGVQGGVDGNPNTFYDYNTVDRITSVSFDRRLHSFSFSGALNYMFNENWALYGRYSQGQKAPDLDVYFAANREETIGLLNPQKRTTRQVEMGLKARSGKINLFVTPFYSILSGVPNSQFLSSEDGGFYTPEMLYGKYRTVGVELEMEYSLNSQLSIRGIATFQRSKIVTLESWAGNNPGPDDDTKISFSGNETDNTPRAIINISPTYSLNKWFTSATWSYLGQRQTNVGNVFVLPGFSQFNLSAGYGFNEKINLSLNVNNIFNNYGVMSWVRPGGILEVIEGNNSFTSEQYEQAVSNSTPFSTISIQPRAIYLTTTIKF
ncbi:TonB-dependent receptor [Sphingobacterium hungaricum]|uniref:TonB-dependent receptor domain-containing protein n=1 Tax=Sphingobacterium hungaricum TaxID=2082723 RepID=UPI0018CA934E|nr:TonB-dependent receptor [Sphingobacterium hungaricum]